MQAIRVLGTDIIVVSQAYIGNVNLVGAGNVELDEIFYFWDIDIPKSILLGPVVELGLMSDELEAIAFQIELLFFRQASNIVDCLAFGLAS